MSSQAPSSDIKFSAIKNLISGNTSGPIAQSSFTNFNPFSGNTSGSISISSKIAGKYPFPPKNSNESAMNVCFACRIIVPTYTGPVFRLRRSSDNVVQDFYTDKTQSFLTTGANNTGTTFSSWIGGNTAYVTIWYDQSGNGNNATNSNNNTTQPYLENTAPGTSGKYVIRFVRANTTVLYLNSIQPNTVFSHFYNTQNFYGATILSTAYDYQVRFGFGCTSITSDQNGGDWFYNGAIAGSYLEYNNGVDQNFQGSGDDSILLNSWNVLTLSVTNPIWVTDQTNFSESSFTRIGQDGFDPASRSIDGWISEMICHNKMITVDDINCYYNNRFF